MEFWDSADMDFDMILIWLGLAACFVSSTAECTMNIHLLLQDRVDMWLAAFPDHRFFLYNHHHHYGGGYDINYINRTEQWMESLYEKGGVFIGAPYDPRDLKRIVFEGGQDKHLLFKEKRQEKGHCPWCINGFFQICSDFLMVPPKSVFLKEAIHLNSEKDITHSLTIAAKRHGLRKLLKRPSSQKSMESRFYTTIEGIKISLACCLTVLDDGHLRPFEITASSGEVHCPPRNPPTTLKEANMYLQSCELEVGQETPRIDLLLNGSSVFRIYRLEKLVTVVVKTYGRMGKALELVASANAKYPGMQILVGNDSRDASSEPEGQKRGFYYVPMPYDVGLSEGRNILVKHVNTPYALFLDDDFTLDDESDIAKLVYELESREADIVGGRSPNCNVNYAGTIRITTGRQGDRQIRLMRPKEKDGCYPVDIIPNLFLARTSLFTEKNLWWDSSLKLGEHEDFFIRAKRKGVRVLTCPSVIFHHHQDPPEAQSKEYRKKRNRVWNYLEVSLKKQKANELIAFGHSVIKLIDIEKKTIKRVKLDDLLPFSVHVQWEDVVQKPRYRLELLNSKNVRIRSFLTEASDVTIPSLEPDSYYKLLLRPGNLTQFAADPVSINIKTPPYKSNSCMYLEKFMSFLDLLVNGNFAGSCKRWRAGLGTLFGLVPLFFPHNDPHFNERKLAGHFHEHIEGRQSQWAFQDRSLTNRNYAAVMQIPYSSPSHSVAVVAQSVPPEKIIYACRKSMDPYVTATAWVRVDKVWGEPIDCSLLLELEHGEHRQIYRFNPFLTNAWQYGLVKVPCDFDTSDPTSIKIKLMAHRGAVYIDDCILTVQ